MRILLLHGPVLRAAWDTAVANPTCIRLDTKYIVIGFLDAVPDTVTSFIPMPLLWRIRISSQKKTQLITMFLLGGLKISWAPYFDLCLD